MWRIFQSPIDSVSSHTFTTISPRFTVQNTTLRNHISPKTLQNTITTTPDFFWRGGQNFRYPKSCPAGRDPCAGSGHFVTCVPVLVGSTAWVLPLVGIEDGSRRGLVCGAFLCRGARRPGGWRLGLEECGRGSQSG